MGEAASLASVLDSHSIRPRPGKSQRSEGSEIHPTWARVCDMAGRRYVRATFGSYQANESSQVDALKAVEAFADEISKHVDNGNGMILYGPPGTGKDHLMFACIRQACIAQKSVEWRNGLDWFGSLRDRIDKGGDEENAVRELVNCDVLALSDPLPPHGDLSSYQGQMLLRVIDRRYRRVKSTWVTLNVEDSVEAEQRMGPALVDRLRDGALTIHCNWPSHRKSL